MFVFHSRLIGGLRVFVVLLCILVTCGLYTIRDRLVFSHHREACEQITRNTLEGQGTSKLVKSLDFGLSHDVANVLVVRT